VDVGRLETTGLILNEDTDGSSNSLQALIQDWHRFMLTHIEYVTPFVVLGIFRHLCAC
jgi:hypothetical protein